MLDTATSSLIFIKSPDMAFDATPVASPSSPNVDDREDFASCLATATPSEKQPVQPSKTSHSSARTDQEQTAQPSSQETASSDTPETDTDTTESTGEETAEEPSQSDVETPVPTLVCQFIAAANEAGISSPLSLVLPTPPAPPAPEEAGECQKMPETPAPAQNPPPVTAVATEIPEIASPLPVSQEGVETILLPSEENLSSPTEVSLPSMTAPSANVEEKTSAPTAELPQEDVPLVEAGSVEMPAGENSEQKPEIANASPSEKTASKTSSAGKEILSIDPIQADQSSRENPDAGLKVTDKSNQFSTVDSSSSFLQNDIFSQPQDSVMQDAGAPTSATRQPLETTSPHSNRPVETVRASALIEKVQQALDAQPVQSPRHMVMQLDPPHLGRVTVNLQQTAAGWTVNWSVTQNETREWINQQLPSLQQQSSQQQIVWNPPTVENSHWDLFKQQNNSANWRQEQDSYLPDEDPTSEEEASARAGGGYLA
ncbi:MAG: flagellar hook-length control protein FliK [Verrucomicrobiae bacterium]|nr:flagellar hook-length control protein FliK [Verrucomicrobiae bacterium]